MRSRVVQDAVTCGVWCCLLVDVLGNYAGQNHDASWVPIIFGTAVVLVVATAAAVTRLTQGEADD